jgi:myosin-crossreactive antigen
MDEVMKTNVSPCDRQVYLVGGGIASLAAAAFLIRDGDLLGQNITILEESTTLGGQPRRVRIARDRLCPARRPDAREQIPVYV